MQTIRACPAAGWALSSCPQALQSACKAWTFMTPETSPAGTEQFIVRWLAQMC